MKPLLGRAATHSTDGLTYGQAVSLLGSVTGSAYQETIGDGTTKVISITHGLATRDVIVAVFQAVAPFGEVDSDVDHTDDNTLTLTFQVAPEVAEFRVVVLRTGAPTVGPMTTSNLIVLGKNDPVPDNLAPNTVVLRKTT
jgi:hypothetical protein